MSDLHGRVWNEVVRAIHADPRTGTVEDRVALRDGNAAEATDRILAIIREALLSDGAVGAGYRNLTHLHPWGVRDAIAAALDAAGITEADDNDA